MEAYGLAAEVDPLHGSKGRMLKEAALVFEDDIRAVYCRRDREGNIR